MITFKAGGNRLTAAKIMEILTLKKAKELKGKTILWTYYGYEMNPSIMEKMVVGEIMSEWDFYKTQPCEGFNSRVEYWESYMSEAQKNDYKNTLVLVSQDGENTFVRCHLDINYFEEPTFTCSDIDRPVFFVECDE